MDKLKIGEIERVGDVLFTTAQAAGMTVPALELRLEGPVDEALLAQLEKGRLEIRDGSGVLLGSYTGYDTVVRRSVVVAKVSDAQKELEEARAQLAKLEAENAALLYQNLTGEVSA